MISQVPALTMSTMARPQAESSAARVPMMSVPLTRNSCCPCSDRQDSASTFGSHACFYTDATVLTAQATGTTPFQHAITQLPYALIAALIAVVGYLLMALF